MRWQRGSSVLFGAAQKKRTRLVQRTNYRRVREREKRDDRLGRERRSHDSDDETLLPLDEARFADLLQTTGVRIFDAYMVTGKFEMLLICEAPDIATSATSLATRSARSLSQRSVPISTSPPAV
jgi:hypothetical protein